MIRSRQTYQATSGIKYNPFHGATILFFPKDRSDDNPRVYILKPNWRDGTASCCGGRVHVEMNQSRQPVVTVNGKPTTRFSIKYPYKLQKRRWATY